MDVPAQPPENPQAKVEPAGIVSSLDMPHKRGSWFRRHPRISGLLVLLLIIVIFLAGYQLAVLQAQNDDLWLPHVGGSDFTKTSCSPLEASCSTSPCSNCVIEDEPVIYLYPQQTEPVTVHEQFINGLSTSIPAYNSVTGWQVTAQPNGSLTNASDGKSYPYLFWESQPGPEHYDMTTGFVVAGKDTKTFMQRELATIGLSSGEAQTFINYWVPRMDHNTYNLIHFAGSDYTDYSKLTISPRPDSLLRVNMAFKPLQNPIGITPQTFTPFVRHGFTVVEWGGAELR